jgi:hypothetical protein
VQHPVWRVRKGYLQQAVIISLRLKNRVIYFGAFNRFFLENGLAIRCDGNSFGNLFNFQGKMNYKTRAIARLLMQQLAKLTVPGELWRAYNIFF